uniref:NADPH-dependent diflavin oxidoreductase 1 n=3 Tax=Clastoptera arizonana TaxID=38151 RepID=A0A1B6DR54_9HEMI
MENQRLVVLFGSETGNAQEVAERIWREAKRFHFKGPICSMDEYPISQLIYESLVIFVCSTTGQGDQPVNMKKFWKFLLRKQLPTNSLQNLRFGVLGLGDSSYVKFNHVAKKLHKRLEGIGGNALCSVGLADDQHDLGADAVVDPWIENLWTVLRQYYILPENFTNMDSSLPSSRWDVKISENISNLQLHDLKWEKDEENLIKIATVVSNERITALEHFQDVRLIRLNCESKYIPGDVVVIRPQNSPNAVKHLLEMLSPIISPDAILYINECDSDMPVPLALAKPISLVRCAQEYWDLNAVPKRYVFQLLSQFESSEMEKEKLTELASASGQEELYNYCNRPRRTILEVLSDFPHVVPNIPVPYLFEIFQPIRPRSFSIASSPKAHPGEIHILLAVVKYKTKLVTPRLGLCSNWLASLKEGNQLRVALKEGSFTFKRSNVIPLIMVGPGTGVAPFRSIIHENVANNMRDKNNLLLIFGSRNQAGDFHFSSEWLKLVEDGLLNLLTAFSRDQSHKIYVQNIIEENSSLIWSYLKRTASIYVAGNSNNMPNSVKEAFINVFEKEGQINKEDATKRIEEMEINGRYQTETWS